MELSTLFPFFPEMTPLLPLILYTLMAMAWLWFSFPTLKKRQRLYYTVSFMCMAYVAAAFIQSDFLYLMILAVSATFSFCTYVVDLPHRSASVLLAFLGFLLLMPSAVSPTLWVLWFMSLSLQNYFFHRQGVVKARGDLLKSTCFWGGIVLINLLFAYPLLSQMSLSLLLISGGFASVLPFFISVGMSPVLEYLFDFLSSLTLLELSSLDHPLIKRLQVEAPGTFHHSLLLATLSEQAADDIHANGLLTRVGCLYHDIGKMKRPIYFVENQAYFGVANPHDYLNPRMSKLIVTAHPNDGLKLGSTYQLPEVVKAFMPEHHGTLLCGYFYAQALKQEDKKHVSKAQFRYSGPKPQSRETAIVMLADAAESAVRALNTPHLDEVESLLETIFKQRIEDGQFDECPITMQDILKIKKSFIKGLSAIHHQRVNYAEKINQVRHGILPSGSDASVPKPS
jgi:putative nucleotidyltransferase with HDIG domain